MNLISPKISKTPLARSRFVAAAVFLICFGRESIASTALSISGANDGNPSIDSQVLLTLGFKLQSPWTDVTIRPDILTAGPLHAFLTTQIGPGTTAANEIASGILTENASGPTTVFSGLSLAPGNYFFSLTTSGAGAYQGTSAPTISLAPGVEFTGFQFATAPFAAYAPASDFLPGGPTLGRIEIAGTAVPEPRSFILIAFGAAALIAARRRTS